MSMNKDEFKRVANLELGNFVGIEGGPGESEVSVQEGL